VRRGEMMRWARRTAWLWSTAHCAACPASATRHQQPMQRAIRSRPRAESGRARLIAAHRPSNRIKDHIERANRVGDVLDGEFAAVFELQAELAAHGVADTGRYTDAVRLGKGLQSCSDIHGIAINVARHGDHITGVDADSEADTAIVCCRGTGCGSARLYLNRGADRVDRAVESAYKAIPGPFDDVPVIALGRRRDQ
jgi:hypothetical protein